MISHWDNQDKWYNFRFKFEIRGFKNLFFLLFFLQLYNIVNQKHLDSNQNVTCVEPKLRSKVLLELEHTQGRTTCDPSPSHSAVIPRDSPHKYCPCVRFCVYYVFPCVCMCMFLYSRLCGEVSWFSHAIVNWVMVSCTAGVHPSSWLQKRKHLYWQDEMC